MKIEDLEKDLKDEVKEDVNCNWVEVLEKGCSNELKEDWKVEWLRIEDWSRDLVLNSSEEGWLQQQWMGKLRKIDMVDKIQKNKEIRNEQEVKEFDLEIG